MYFIHIFLVCQKKAATTTKHLKSMLDRLFQNGQMVCGVTMYDTTDGCVYQFRCYK